MRPLPSPGIRPTWSSSGAAPHAGPAHQPVTVRESESGHDSVRVRWGEARKRGLQHIGTDRHTPSKTHANASQTTLDAGAVCELRLGEGVCRCVHAACVVRHLQRNKPVAGHIISTLRSQRDRLLANLPCSFCRSPLIPSTPPPSPLCPISPTHTPG